MESRRRDKWALRGKARATEADTCYCDEVAINRIFARQDANLVVRWVNPQDEWRLQRGPTAWQWPRWPFGPCPESGRVTPGQSEPRVAACKIRPLRLICPAEMSARIICL